MSLVRHELYKLYSQKVIYIAFSIFTLFYSMYFFETVKYNRESIDQQKEAYALYGGQITDDKILWAEEIMKEVYRVQKERRQQGGSGPLLDEGLRFKLWAANSITRAADTREHRAAELRHWTEIRNALVDKGREGSYEEKVAGKQIEILQNVGDPDKAFFQQGWRNVISYINEIGYLFAAALTILGTANGFSQEYTSRMDHLIFGSRHGRRRVVLAKMASVVIYCASIIAVYSGVVLSLNGIFYGLDGWNERLVNVTDLFSSTSFSGPVWLFYLQQQLYAVMGCSVLGMLVLLISSRTAMPMIPAFLGGLVFMLPIVVLFTQIPLKEEWLAGLFLFMLIIQLQGLDIAGFHNVLGVPVIYSHFLLMIMMLTLIVISLLLLWSIRKKQVN